VYVRRRKTIVGVGIIISMLAYVIGEEAIKLCLTRTTPLDKFNDPERLYFPNGLGVPQLDEEVNFLVSQLPDLEKDENGLFIIYGDSGIGKSTSCRQIADVWNKKNYPARYIVLDRGDHFKSLLLECFHTTDTTVIYTDTKRYVAKGKRPILIIDNIDLLCKDGTFSKEIVKFFIDFSKCGSKVILLSSQAKEAHILEAACENSATIAKMKPRDPRIIKNYFKDIPDKKLSDEEISYFVDMFDGNMAMLRKLVYSKSFELFMDGERNELEATLLKIHYANPEVLPALQKFTNDVSRNSSFCLSEEALQRFKLVIDVGLVISSDNLSYKFRNNLIPIMINSVIADSKPNGPNSKRLFNLKRALKTQD